MQTLCPACSTSLVDIDPKILHPPEFNVNRSFSGTNLVQGLSALWVLSLDASHTPIKQLLDGGMGQQNSRGKTFSDPKGLLTMNSL